MKKIFISIIVSLITSISVAQSSYRGFVNTADFWNMNKSLSFSFMRILSE